MADIVDKKVWSTKQIVTFLITVATLTFYATLIYVQIQTIEQRLDKKIKVINDNVERINKLEKN